MLMLGDSLLRYYSGIAIPIVDDTGIKDLTELYGITIPRKFYLHFPLLICFQTLLYAAWPLNLEGLHVVT